MKTVKQLAGTIKALWHKSPAPWVSRSPVWTSPSGRHTTALVYKSHTTRNPWYNYNFTLYSLQYTPQPTNPHKPILLFTTHKYTQPFQNISKLEVLRRHTPRCLMLTLRHSASCGLVRIHSGPIILSIRTI